MTDDDDVIAVYPDETFNRRQRETRDERQRQATASDFAYLDQLADLMDSKFQLPGTNFRFGLEPLLDFVPILGNTISLAISAHIIQKAYQHDVPNDVKARMIANVAIEWAVGNVPVIGNMFDAAWKAHRMNVDLLKKHARR